MLEVAESGQHTIRQKPVGHLCSAADDHCTADANGTSVQPSEGQQHGMKTMVQAEQMKVCMLKSLLLQRQCEFLTQLIAWKDLPQFISYLTALMNTNSFTVLTYTRVFIHNEPRNHPHMKITWLKFLPFHYDKLFINNLFLFVLNISFLISSPTCHNSIGIWQGLFSKI